MYRTSHRRYVKIMDRDRYTSLCKPKEPSQDPTESVNPALLGTYPSIKTSQSNGFIPSSETMEIRLPKGLTALVDAEDYPNLHRHRWYVKQNSRGEWYAFRKTKTSSVFMHREILGVPKGLEADHINGNGLDNRRSNLRFCTRLQNCHNRRKTNSKTSSKFKGVSRQNGKWRAQIRIPGYTQYLGIFDSEEDAAKAYNEAAIEHFGSFANLNQV